jgi:two-component system chemotaxis response regulator CheY
MAKVMIVDDAQFMRLRLSKMLVACGHEVVEAEDGNQAVAVYQLTRPDVVFMDITMPNKDGLEALSEIRQIDPQAKVIMLTALEQQPMLLQAFQAGAKECLLKPCSMDRVIKTIERLLHYSEHADPAASAHCG